MGSVRQATSKGSTNEELSAQIARLKGELDAIKRAMSKTGGAVTAPVCSCAACTEAAGRIAHHVKENVEGAVDDVETFASHNPGYVLGGSLGVGVILGMLIQKRLSSAAADR
ncbi:MAG: hypothetical protein WAW96_05080 [Alphaproteobacteria bacterium]